MRVVDAQGRGDLDGAVGQQAGRAFEVDPQHGGGAGLVGHDRAAEVRGEVGVQALLLDPGQGLRGPVGVARGSPGAEGGNGGDDRDGQSQGRDRVGGGHEAGRYRHHLS
ncbi:hypothetical protein [Streptomyces sp. PalvLS-984]|uniref:hypothetical protein n=1 Tax=Streptomyces sp. PalvLS-984 TaxID=1839782 RepID=UPI00114C89F0|nr:hypothetical protein [Streptomyces sp. PalvLS-984]MYQ55258.1 hypothetical protein [Streptomyces sp. SID4941]